MMRCRQPPLQAAMCNGPLGPTLLIMREFLMTEVQSFDYGVQSCWPDSDVITVATHQIEHTSIDCLAT